jgi:hypothetical protein
MSFISFLIVHSYFALSSTVIEHFWLLCELDKLLPQLSCCTSFHCGITQLMTEEKMCFAFLLDCRWSHQHI